MKPSTKEIAVFGMLGAMMYASKLIMEIAPNIHLIGIFVVAITLVYGKKALYPIYIFVIMTGLFSGFAMWWVPYLYIWTVLFFATMLLPKTKKNAAKLYGSGAALEKKEVRRLAIICMSLCSAHGFLYGILYAPAQAFMFGLSFEGMLAWIVAGIPFDIIHGTSNFLCGALVLPIVKVISTAEKYTGRTDW